MAKYALSLPPFHLPANMGARGAGAYFDKATN